MYRCSNKLIGLLNLLTLLASVSIIGAGLWMAKRTATCEHYLQKPILVLGFLVLMVSLAGFIGACFNVAWVMWLYLVAMLFVIGGLLVLTVFGFVVTSKGGGRAVAGRVYKEYTLEDYHPWLRKRVQNPEYWTTIRSCVVGSKICDKVASWTPLDYLRRELTPIQSGCCKPPTSCVYNSPTMMSQDSDCYKWNNDATLLCYDCDSCRAGVLEQARRDWKKISVLNVIILVALVALYSIGCCAFRNIKRDRYDYPFGRNRMSKIRPRWDYHWWRNWRDRREQLY